MTSIEDLNKTQFILLVLLITFVSSMATAIITTSLLSEAPTTITQTINRVVERTIEIATPISATKDERLSKEAEELISAVKTASESVVRVNELDVTTGAEGSLNSMGVIMLKDGIVVSRLAASTSTTATSSRKYAAFLSDNTKLPLSLVSVGETDNMAVFKIQVPESTTQ